MRAVRFRQAHGLPLKPLNSPRWIFLICLNWLSPLPTSFRDSCPCECAFCSIRIPPINYNRKLSGLLNPAVQSLNSTPAAAREYTSLRSPFPVLDIKLRRREIRQRELKVRGQATPKVNSFCALLLTTTMNQTTIFHFSRSSLGQLCVQRSQLRPRTPDLHPSASRTASSLLRRTASQPNTIMVR